MDRSEWQTRLRIQTYFGLFEEGVQVPGALSVRTNPCGHRAIFMISVASATIRVHPTVAIGASILAVTPSSSQNATALGIDFISLVAKYQNAWLNTGIFNAFIVLQDAYLLVCLLASSVHLACQSPCTISLFIGLLMQLICLTSSPSSKNSRGSR